MERLSTRPEASVVIASNRSVELLEACLEAVLPQAEAAGAEVVVCRPAGAESDVVRGHRRGVRFVDAPASADIPRLRGIGLSAVRGDRAALTEDHCLPEPGWLVGLLEALDEGADAAGGAMGNARTGRMVDRGAFLAEYGFFAGPGPGDGILLTGANVAYGPRVLARVARWMARGEWEDVVHHRLRNEGRSLRFVPLAGVRQNATYALHDFLVDRYCHGRDYARVRLREREGRGRLFRLLTTPLLPPVLLLRVARRTASSGIGPFVTALPATAAFLTAWSVGEAVGYLRGPARPADAADTVPEPEPSSTHETAGEEPEAPALSVVVPSVNGPEDLLDCLEALDGQRGDVPVEVLVPDRLGEGLRGVVRERFPWVRLLPADPDATIPDLRAMAFDRARAPRVAVIEDHVLVPVGWARSLLEARDAEGESAVIGGAVENGATERWVDRAAFLCEYSHLLPPLPEGPADWLTGNNTLYDREALVHHRGMLGGDRWENELHDTLRAAGVPLVHRPRIRVVHRKHYTVSEYLHQRFLYARSFAGARLRDASLPARFAYGLAAFALPPILLVRIVRNAARGGVGPGEIVAALPLLLLFTASWGVGEVVGGWLGPGDAISRVR